MSENEYQDISTENLERIRDLAAQSAILFDSLGKADEKANAILVVQDASDELASRKATSDG